MPLALMCLAVPGQIKSFDEGRHYATIEVSGVRRKVNVDLLQEVVLCELDWVLIHVGFAMSKISPEQAEEQLRLLQRLGQASGALESFEGYRFETESDR